MNKSRRPKKTHPCACTKSGLGERADLRDKAQALCGVKKPETGKGVKKVK